MALLEKQQWLIDRAKDWADDHEETPPRVQDWQKVRGTGWPSYLTAVRAFGTWDQFIAACGWTPRGRGKPKK